MLFCVLLKFLVALSDNQSIKNWQASRKENNLLPLQACKWMSEQLHAEMCMQLPHFPTAYGNTSACQNVKYPEP